MTLVGHFSEEAERVFNAIEEHEQLVREHEEDLAWWSREPLPEAPFEEE